jgi:5-methylcytosine-specific restriction protein A
MPSAPPKHCPAGHPPFTGRRCPVCSAAVKARAEAARPSARARGYDSKWSRESKVFLARPENRYCACGCGQVAEMVDHKVAHKGDMRLFWDRSNWQPMTRRCNSRKAVREEGAFGNPIRQAGGRSEFDPRDGEPTPPSRAQSSGNWEFWG